MNRMTAVAALVLAAACGGSAPPEDGPAPQAPGGPGGPETLVGMGGGPPSVFALIGAREQLGLNGAQVTELDSIGRVWSARNDSLQRQLNELDGRRNATTMERARPILLRMAQNNQWAGTAVETLLTEDQRRIACTLPNAQAGERRAPPGGRGPGGGPGGRAGTRPRGGPGDAPAGTATRRGWPWCVRMAPADSAAG